MDTNDFAYEHYGILVQNDEDELPKSQNAQNLNNGKYIHIFFYIYVLYIHM